MIELNLPHCTVDVSQYDPERNGVRIIQEITGTRLDMLVDIYRECAIRHGCVPSNPRMLLAHSQGESGYDYLDEVLGQTHRAPVQQWIDIHGEVHDGLFVVVCNPNHYDEIRARRSLVIWPGGKFKGGEFGVMFDDVYEGLILPEEFGLLKVKRP